MKASDEDVLKLEKWKTDQAILREKQQKKAMLPHVVAIAAALVSLKSSPYGNYDVVAEGAVEQVKAIYKALGL